MLFSYNILKVDDKPTLLAHLQQLNPPAVLFYETELDFARQVKQALPNCEVIIRFWPDSDVYRQLTPQQWLDQHMAQSMGGLMLYTTNESGLSQAVIDWHVTLMYLAIERKVKLCLLNPSTGTWDASDMPRLLPLFQLASQHRDLFVIGLHSYAGGIITSGIRGGFPNHAGVQPGLEGGLDLTNVNNWSQVLPGDTKFHVGRHKIIVDYCKAQGLNPRLGLTEAGFDFTGDIAGWLNTLPHNGGSINGWRTLQPYWNVEFPQWSSEQAFVEQWKWAEPNLCAGLDFVLFFCHGNDGSWGNYDIAGTSIPGRLLDYAKKTATGTHPAIPPPPVVTPPAPTPAPQPTETTHTYPLPDVLLITTDDATKAKAAADWWAEMMKNSVNLLKTISGFTDVQLSESS